MKTKDGNKPFWLLTIRWTARILAILIVAFFLFMFIGESIGGRTAGTPPLVLRDYILLSLMALFNIGLVVGLWKEGVGGLISFVSMAVKIIYLQFEGQTPVIFYITLLPAILYILSFYFHRKL